ncbi:hypothetical protein N6B72_21635 [Chryseobacterium soli]|uniref:hypothetical protein n=1 Tax=Chryseobacterium soli TaxID=445961 RepID=UPI002953382D|nr:hypothetical protein [Chryseobacterium soli]MDV7699522.1 hypothetical protein [Chryseobacterium soli]
MHYQIKKPEELTETEIQYILKLWDISAWSTMTSKDFRAFFIQSEFHVLLDSMERIQAIIRLNFDFTLEISGKKYHFAEAVGLVSAEKNKGYGKKLIQYFLENCVQKNRDVIGFCSSELRIFYEKCQVPILYNKAKDIQEKNDSEWMNSEDDDILIFNASEEKKAILNHLDSTNKAYLIL